MNTVCKKCGIDSEDIKYLHKIRYLSNPESYPNLEEKFNIYIENNDIDIEKNQYVLKPTVNGVLGLIGLLYHILECHVKKVTA